jgi:uncharacterized repeat protein (TIGR01451 family)
VPCEGSNNCFLPSGTYGVLSTSNTTYAPAYAAAPGYDMATGLGSVNATNLVNNWDDSDTPVSVSASVISGGQLSYAVTVSDNGPQSATGVVVTTKLPSGYTLVTAKSPGCTQSGQTVTCTVGSLAVGAKSQLTVVIMPPSGSGNVTLAFTASSNNPSLDPADATEDVGLEYGGDTSGDGPLPLWAYAALAVLLCLIAVRRPALQRPTIRRGN